MLRHSRRRKFKVVLRIVYIFGTVAFESTEDGGDDALRSLPPGVIVRVYGDNTELLIDRAKRH